MKKYSTPEMKALAFAAMEAISNDYTASNSNDVSMDWGGQGGQANG